MSRQKDVTARLSALIAKRRIAHLEAELARHQRRMAGMITIEAVSETRWRNRELEAQVADLLATRHAPSSPEPARAPSPALPPTSDPRP